MSSVVIVDLLHPYTTEEVKDALFHMNPSKHILGDSLTAFVLRILAGGRFSTYLNYNFLAFIQKCKDLIDFASFLSDRICSVPYKVVSKVLVNRLKLVMDFVI